MRCNFQIHLNTFEILWVVSTAALGIASTAEADERGDWPFC
jgi:hypothetical protein